jgi:hypothetical protein
MGVTLVTEPLYKSKLVQTIGYNPVLRLNINVEYGITYLSKLTAMMTCELLQCDDINNVEPSDSQGWAITLPTYRPGKPSGSGNFTTGT